MFLLWPKMCIRDRGYDAERLCLISLGALQPQAPGYDAEAQDSATLVDISYNLVRYVKAQRPGRGEIQDCGLF